MGSRALRFPLARVLVGSSGTAQAFKGTAGVRLGILRTGSISLLVAISYYLGTKIGFALTPAQTPISTFWPPNAILLASFLLTPQRLWVPFLCAVFPAHLLAQLCGGVPVASVLGWFAGNTGEALLGAACIRYFVKDEPLFESVRGTVIFIGFGVLLAPILTSFLDAAVVVTTGLDPHYWTLWLTRLSSNIISNLTIVPTIVLLGVHGWGWLKRVTVRTAIEAAALIVGIAGVSIFVFDSQTGHVGGVPAWICAPLPLLLWVSMRFGIAGLSPSMVVVAVVAMWNAMRGRGLLEHGSMAVNVLFLHVLLTVFAVPLMLLCAVLVEQKLTRGALRNARTKLIDAQEQERHRVARELHDDIVQQLTLITLEVDRLRTDSAVPTKPAFDKLHDQLANVSSATRDLSHDLHSFTLEYVGFERALRELCRQSEENSGLVISLDRDAIADQLAPDISLCLYRIAQEGLQNVVKHSEARNVAVSLKIQGKRILLRIVDDGMGIIDEKKVGGMGLNSMRERAMALGGGLNIISTRGEGTAVEAWVPLPRTHEESGMS